MENENWFGIPRKEIDWHPTIDYNKCISCMACVKKCTHGVYAVIDGRPKITAQEKCVVGCTNCQPLCKQKAISFPSRSYLQDLTKRKEFNFRFGCGCDKK
jgi:CDP-4-dehydro-6-deoxyglucose reductase, E3